MDTTFRMQSVQSFIKRGIYKPVATVLTQTVIDPYDDAFADPEKIIGRVLTEEEAEAEEEEGQFRYQASRWRLQTYCSSSQASEDHRD